MENNYVNAANDLAVTQGPSSQQSPAIEGVGDCPGCGSKLRYTKNEKTVECPYCGNTVNVKDIKSSSSVRKNTADESAASLAASFAMSIDSTDSALVYVKNFFKDYNWDSYKQSATMAVSEIDTMVEKNKIKHGATAGAWILDFESKIMPLTKKLEGLGEQESVLLDLYDGKDNTAIMAKYDTYEKVTALIKDSAEKLFGTLVADIENADTYGADADTVSDMKLRVNTAVELYNKYVHDFTDIDSVPAIEKSIELRKARIAQKLASEGIDAEATYKKALELYDASEDKSDALRLFQSIREYGDSKDYIEKINEFFNFDKRLIKLANKHFLIKQVAAPTFSVAEPVKEDEEEKVSIPAREIAPTYALYEIVCAKAYEPAAVSGISCFLSFYGNKLFYIKRDRSLCSYDVLTHIETELDRGNVGDYPCDRIFSSNDGTAIYIKKKLSPFAGDKKRGCFGAFFSLFKKKPKPFTDDKNNFAVIKIDKANNTASVEIDRLVDITECYDERMFYIAYQAVGTEKIRSLNINPSFMVCNLRTGEKSQVLGDDCHIHDVIDEKVIYTTWDPNEYNKMLFAYDLKTDVTTLIEANIFDYFKTIEGRVYYTVGNKKHAPLFSNNLDGTDRLEIMRNIKDILAVIEGWMYVTRGSGRNTTLFKISPDGKETILVCTDVKYIIDIKASYTYYTDGDGALHVVRNDGKNDLLIAYDIDEKNIILDKDFIYYLRHEPVGKNKKAYSLYRMEPDGSNTKKLIFNVNSIQNYDENYIYVYKCQTTNYFATEKENDEVKSEKRVKFKVSKFFIFDKNTETEAPLLALGLPNEETRIEKRGCFKKDLKRTVTYSEISNKIPYKKEGLAAVGEIYAEQTSIE